MVGLGRASVDEGLGSGGGVRQDGSPAQCPGQTWGPWHFPTQPGFTSKEGDPRMVEPPGPEPRRDQPRPPGPGFGFAGAQRGQGGGRRDAQRWAVGKRGGRASHGRLRIRGRAGPRGRAPPPPPPPPEAGAGPGRCPQLVKNPAVSESSSFPTSERQTSPLLLYYNAEPDGLLGVAPPRPPRPPSFIQTQTPALMPRGAGTLPWPPPQCGNRRAARTHSPRRRGRGADRRLRSSRPGCREPVGRLAGGRRRRTAETLPGVSPGDLG